MKGKLIVIEGPDGCGKTSTVDALKELLKNDNNYIFAKDPSSDIQSSKEIKDIIMNNEYDVDNVTQFLLFEAARRELWVKIIKPALSEGKNVILDRFTPSTFVYQKNISKSIITIFNAFVCDGRDDPDYIVYFRVGLEEQYRRIIKRKDNDKMDVCNIEELRYMRNKYKEILNEFPHSKVIDVKATDEDTPEQAAQKILNELKKEN